MDMNELQKVMLGLECCAENEACQGCPYDNMYVSPSELPCTQNLWLDALRILRGLMPRVMTLDEVAQGVDPVYFEYRNSKNNIVVAIAKHIGTSNGDIWNFAILGESKPVSEPGAVYNVTWRCWTSEPFVEQRLSTKWGDINRLTNQN